MRFNKFAFRLFAVVLTLVILLSGLSVSAIGVIDETGDVPYDTFSYWTSSSTDRAVRVKGMYNLDKVVLAEEIGSQISSFTDVCYDEHDNMYILDGTGSRILVFDNNYNYIRTISEITDTATGQAYNYAGAYGLTVSAKDLVYICDYNNNRVLISDTAGNLVKNLTLPDSSLIPSDFVYKPTKVTVDSSDYVYVLSDGSYYGAILYSPTGEFLGFYGANTVATTVVQFFVQIWEDLTMTDERRATAIRKLPFQFTDLYVDKSDFIYTATGNTGGIGMSKGQIKRLSPGGLNILNADSQIFGLQAAVLKRPKTSYPDLSGVAVNDENYIFTYDSTSGYIFIYDDDCVLLNSFGGGSARDGDQVGNFKKISAIDVNSKNDIVVIDSYKLAFTVFKINDYGKIVFEADTLTRNGNYELAQPMWLEVLSQDRNMQLAYSGLARTYFAAKDYHNALKYAKEGYDYDTYSYAFEYVRKGYLEENLNWLIPVVVITIVALVLFNIYKKRKGIVFVKNREIRLLMRVMLHPNDVFADVKQKGYGSTTIGTLLIILYYVTATIKETASGFLFRSPSVTAFNSLLVLVQTLGVVLLWTICNWAVCTLMDGKGKMREIYIVTSYSLVPLIISNIVYTVASNVLISSESSFLSIFVTIMQLFMAFILITGIILVHDYSFGKFVGTSILSALGILIVVFLMIAIFILVQQSYTFLGTIFREIVYR